MLFPPHTSVWHAPTSPEGLYLCSWVWDQVLRPDERLCVKTIRSDSQMNRQTKQTRLAEILLEEKRKAKAQLAAASTNQKYAPSPFWGVHI